MKIPSSKSSRYRPEIDGLRAFAVVAVIVNHFNKDMLPGGYLGVDIFFVISGYVITSSLFGRPSKDFKDFITGFYERRIKRLVPALSVFVLLMSIAICMFNPLPKLALRAGLSSLFGLSNLYLLRQSTDYFAPSTELNVFTHTWSLGVEEQFYILFPFLIWFSGFGRQTLNGARNLFLIVGALTIASLIGFLYLYPTNQPAAYFLMPSRFWEMASGCLIFIGFQKRASIEQFLERVPPLLVLALILGVMYLPMSLAAGSTIAVVVLSSILIASLKKETAAFNILTNPRVVYIGLISYSLYLWHWGVLSISRWTIGIHWWSVPFQVALMLVLAVASYRWIETPFRKNQWFNKKLMNLLLTFTLSIFTFIFSVLLQVSLKDKFYRGRFPLSDYIGFVYYMDCEHASPFFRSDPISCLTVPKSSRTLYIFGDSFASNLVPSLEKSGKIAGFDNIKYLSNIEDSPFFTDQGKNEWYRHRDIQSVLHSMGSDDVLVWTHSNVPKSDRLNYAKIENEIIYFAKLCNDRKIPLLIIGNPPPFGHQFYTNFNFPRENPSTSLEEARAVLKDSYQLIDYVISRNKDIYFFDPLAHLCSEGVCHAVIDNKLIYADRSPHFNQNGAYILADPFSDMLIKIIAESQLIE